MGRNYGVKHFNYYTHEEFKQGCAFNFWIGAACGISLTIFLGLVGLYTIGLLH